MRPSYASISCVYLVRPSYASRLCYAVRLSRASHPMHPSPASVPVCAAHITPVRLHSFTLVYSFKRVKPVNSFKRLVLLVLLVLLIRPPEQFDPFDPFHPFQAFDSYNPLSNLSVSIRLPPRALRRVKINFFKRRGKPEWFEVFNSFEVFGVFGVYGVFKGVRRVRGFP